MDFITYEEMMVMFVPIVVYWTYSGAYVVFCGRWIEKYRLHSRKEEVTKNIVSKKDVVKGVLMQQSLQATLSFLAFKMNIGGKGNPSSTSHLLLLPLQFLTAMLVFDTWQYFMHRYLHANAFLYRRFHSHHHRLVVPYAFAAQYGHLLDSFLIEMLSGLAAVTISGMPPTVATLFFCFATVKGVDDHCGCFVPWNPFHVVFSNNAAYHDVHHRRGGGKCNFSQPFFVVWDKVFGTYVGCRVVGREGGGFEVQLQPDSRLS